jgi:hypothetical protein
MKKAVLAAAALATLRIGSSEAAPPKLPPQFHGMWCVSKERGKLTTYSRTGCGKTTGVVDDDDTRINVVPNGFSATEYSCRIVDGSIDRGKYTLSMRCAETPENTWRIKVRMHVERYKIDLLFMRSLD